MSFQGQFYKSIHVKTKTKTRKPLTKTKLDMTAKFGRITQNKGHFAVQGHSRSPNFGTNRKLIYSFLYQDDS